MSDPRKPRESAAPLVGVLGSLSTLAAGAAVAAHWLEHDRVLTWVFASVSVLTALGLAALIAWRK